VPLIERELRAEDLDGDALGPIDADQVRIAKTANRSVLGCMDDMAYLCEHIIRHTDIGALNLSLRRNINSASEYHRPIEHVRDRASPEPGYKPPDGCHSPTTSAFSTSPAR